VSAFSYKNETLILQISKSRINEEKKTLKNGVWKKISRRKSSKTKDNNISQRAGGSRKSILIINSLEEIKMDHSVLVI